MTFKLKGRFDGVTLAKALIVALALALIVYYSYLEYTFTSRAVLKLTREFVIEHQVKGGVVYITQVEKLIIILSWIMFLVLLAAQALLNFLAKRYKW